MFSLSRVRESSHVSAMADAAAVSHTCGVCGEGFASKNKLFKHLKGSAECAKASVCVHAPICGMWHPQYKQHKHHANCLNAGTHIHARAPMLTQNLHARARAYARTLTRACTHAQGHERPAHLMLPEVCSRESRCYAARDLHNASSNVCRVP
jgi:hypothetical protein